MEMLISAVIWKDVTYVTTLNKKNKLSNLFIMYTIKYDKRGVFLTLNKQIKYCVFSLHENMRFAGYILDYKSFTDL